MLEAIVGKIAKAAVEKTVESGVSTIQKSFSQAKDIMNGGQDIRSSVIRDFSGKLPQFATEQLSSVDGVKRMVDPNEKIPHFDSKDLSTTMDHVEHRTEVEVNRHIPRFKELLMPNDDLARLSPDSEGGGETTDSSDEVQDDSEQKESVSSTDEGEVADSGDDDAVGAPEGGDDSASEEASGENAETSVGETREGYENWDDVPHTTDPETGRERYELQSGKDAESLNSVPPPANADIYVKDADGRNYIKVETDDKGRIVKISRPRIELAEHSQRTNETLQTVDKKDGRRDGEGNKLDDGGHLVADEFGGSSEQTNLVPMDSEVNRHGEWRKMERDIEKELSKEPPSEVKDFEVEIEYDDDSARPSGFTVSYTLDDGGSTTEITKYINNERSESEDLRNAA